MDDTPPAMSALSVEDVKNSDLTTGLSKGEEDDEPGSKVNCFAATLLGIKCKDEGVDGTAGLTTDPFFISLPPEKASSRCTTSTFFFLEVTFLLFEPPPQPT